MTAYAPHRHTALALILFGSASLFACSEDGDPGTPAGGLQLGQSGNGQGSSSSGEGGGDQADPEGGSGGTSSKGGSGGSGTGANGGTGGTSSKGGSGGSGPGANGGTGGTSSKGGSGGTGGASSKGGSGGSGVSGSGGTGGSPDYFSMADFFMAEGNQETVCSNCLRYTCESQVLACGNLAEGGDCYDLAACIGETAKETDTTLDCAYEACGAAHPTFLANDFLTCLGDKCASECAATPGFTSCPNP